MIVDSSALLAIILNEPEESAFATTLMLNGAAQMSVASYVEVALRLDGRLTDGRDERLDRAVRTLAIELVPVSVEHAHAARHAFSRYGKGRHRARLNFGDCLTYALAKATGEPLLFKGNDFSQTDIQSASTAA